MVSNHPMPFKTVLPRSHGAPVPATSSPSQLVDMTPAVIEAAQFTPESASSASSTLQTETINATPSPQPTTISSATGPSQSSRHIEVARLEAKVRDLEIRNANLGQHNERMNGELEKKRNEISWYIAMHNTMQASVNNIPNLLQESDDHHAEAIRLQRELQTVTTEKTDLQGKLKDCKDKIFRLQPTEQVTELDIGALYTSVCTAVESWVEQQFGDIEDLHSIVSCLEPSAGSDAVHGIARYFRQTGLLNMSEKCPDASFHVMVSVVMVALCDKILQNKGWVLGMDDDDEKLLDDIFDGMSHLEPLRDENTMGAWRSETLQALMKVDRFAKMQSQQLSQLAKLLGSNGGVLGEVSRAQQHDGFDQDGLQSLISMAGDLYKLLASASEQYFFDFFFFSPDDPRGNRLLNQEDAINCNLIDVSTGQQLYGSSQIHWNEDGVGGEMLCAVFPALQKRLRDGTSKLVSKGTILVRFDKAVERKAQG